MLWTLLSVASRTAAAKQAQLRVVTMNIHAWRDSDHRLNFDRLVAQLRTLNADVVCLNEVLHPPHATRHTRTRTPRSATSRRAAPRRAAPRHTECHPATGAPPYPTC